MKQRIGIAMALLGNPTLLVLDEPINGLDADGMRIMREILVDIAKAGATIIHVFRCMIGGVVFAVGLGAISTVILQKTSLV